MSDNNYWGIDRYYSVIDPDAGSIRKSSYFRIIEVIKRSLEETLGDVEAQVRETHKRWNNRIRESIREETKLKLTQGTKRKEVPVEIDANIPEGFKSIFEQLPDPFVWEMLLRKPDLEITRNNLNFIISRFNDILEHSLISEPKNIQAVDETNNIVDQLIRFANSIDLAAIIAGRKEDTLGAYFYKRNLIKLYWIPIGLVARSLKVSVESLALVVMTHELAHAYTHLGKDIDGVQWKTEGYEHSDLPVVEGLAQYYTERVAYSLRDDFPAMLVSYQSLLREQPDEYTLYQNWINGSNKTGELIRFCLRACRVIGEADVEFINDQLEQGKKQPEKNIRGRVYNQPRFLNKKSTDEGSN